MKPYSQVKKVYGPYTSGKDGRLRIVCYYANGQKKTVSYPKYLVETYLGRYLNESETVDHIDCDFTNNNLTNLRILPRQLHARIDNYSFVWTDVNCPVCKKRFKPTKQQVTDQRNGCLKGPFCSRSCAGRGSHKNYMGKNFVRISVRKVYTKSLGEEIFQGIDANSVKPVVNGNAERSLRKKERVETIRVGPKAKATAKT